MTLYRGGVAMRASHDYALVLLYYYYICALILLNLYYICVLKNICTQVPQCVPGRHEHGGGDEG
jgi:hypothetical protein